MDILFFRGGEGSLVGIGFFSFGIENDLIIGLGSFNGGSLVDMVFFLGVFLVLGWGLVVIGDGVWRVVLVSFWCLIVFSFVFVFFYLVRWCFL